MANTLTELIPRIIARGLMVLREKAIMARIVNTDWSDEVASPGDTIDVPISSEVTASDVVPGPVYPTPQSVIIDKVPIALSVWKKAEFHLTDKEINEIAARDNYLPLQSLQAVRSLASVINTTVFSKYKRVFGYTGTAGTTPFAIGSGNFAAPPTDATNLRKILEQQLVPPDMRRAVLDPNAEANALSLPAFADAEKAGSAQVKIQGEMGMKFGMDWFSDTQVPTHTAGTITTGLIAKAATAQALGDKTIVCTTAATTGACALLEGDIITFAGDSQTYVLTANATQAAASTDVTLNIYPALKKALVGSEAVTVKASHVVNLGFHRDAFALAIRPVMENRELDFVTNSQSITDPVTGLSLTLEVYRQYHQVTWEYSVLFGTNCVQPELAARLAG